MVVILGTLLYIVINELFCIIYNINLLNKTILYTIMRYQKNNILENPIN